MDYVQWSCVEQAYHVLICRHPWEGILYQPCIRTIWKSNKHQDPSPGLGQLLLPRNQYIICLVHFIWITTRAFAYNVELDPNFVGYHGE